LSASPNTSPLAPDLENSPAWKQEVNARLVAHRNRRDRSSVQQPALPGLESTREESRAARVAARVAERYSKAPTYSEMLAAEAANAARAAETAAQAAKEAHTAAQAILAGLDIDIDRDDSPANQERDRADRAGNHARDSYRAGNRDRDEEGPSARRSGWDTEREFSTSDMERAAHAAAPAPEPRIQYHVDPDSLPQARQAPSREIQNREAEPPRPRIREDYPTHLEDPFEDAFIAAAQPLPAKLIEFPRELVATRKARPRLAEGPLVDSEAEETSQLRIFEVEPDAISHEAVFKESAVDQILPEWHSIQLDAPDRRQADSAQESYPREHVTPPLGRQNSRKSDPAPASTRQRTLSTLLETLPLHVAPMEDRLMAGTVDCALVLMAFLLFVLVFAASTAHPPTGKLALAAAGVLLVAFFALYQWLFFTYADGTPGMRYAKIALCTFDDENPTRRTMRGRIAALMLSALPAGLGFLWVFFDDDRMTWHDRITRTYQRSYR
jgi:uncharacterized RDD family membrane protein YckC